jgi:hypothetical protein
MSSVHCLKIHLRIPVRVIQDDSIGCHQVQTKSSSTSGNQEDFLVGVGRREVVNLGLPVIKLCVSIKSTVLVLSGSAVIFKDVKHGRKPREDQGLRVVSLCLPHQFVKNLHLATGLDDVLSQFWRVIRLDAWEEVRMVADLSQLDQNVFIMTG